MKKLSDCKPCQKRLGMVILFLAVLGLVFSGREIYKLFKKK